VTHAKRKGVFGEIGKSAEAADPSKYQNDREGINVLVHGCRQRAQKAAIARAAFGGPGVVAGPVLARLPEAVSMRRKSTGGG
jgi:hypothetical protein